MIPSKVKNTSNVQLPFLFGGSGRYMYWLVCNNYITASPTTQSVAVMDTGADDAIITTITLTAGKNFSSLFYRAVDQTVYVLGVGWIDIIDANPDSGTFNTILSSNSFSMGAVTAPVSMYLPWPLDFLTTGGSQSSIVNGSSLPRWYSTDYNTYSALWPRFSGHSNWPNSVYYHESQLIWTNNHLVRVNFDSSNNYTFYPYSFEMHSGGGAFNDLNGQIGPPIRFGNFQILSTSGNAYLVPIENVSNPIITEPFPTIGAANRPIQEYCPNAPGKLFFTAGISNNIISVINFTPGTFAITDGGDIDRTSYKDTNENGACALIYNPYSGRLYCQANNNANVSGVSLVHVYDPTQALLSNMYVRTVTVGEFKSDLRASVSTYWNTVCMNRTRIYEYKDVTI